MWWWLSWCWGWAHWGLVPPTWWWSYGWWGSWWSSRFLPSGQHERRWAILGRVPTSGKTCLWYHSAENWGFQFPVLSTLSPSPNSAQLTKYSKYSMVKFCNHYIIFTNWKNISWWFSFYIDCGTALQSKEEQVIIFFNLKQNNIYREYVNNFSSKNLPALSNFIIIIIPY